ncbi:hypothetical protein Plhal703r1_c26g0108291 [Plasmopara halstedii]
MFWLKTLSYQLHFVTLRNTDSESKNSFCYKAGLVNPRTLWGWNVVFYRFFSASDLFNKIDNGLRARLERSA